MAGIFITSTGTGIGKTHLLAQLLAFDNDQHSLFTVSKPIISGWPQKTIEIQQTDTAMLLYAQKKSFTLNEIEAISPWRFTHPLSPDMAAKREGKSVDPDTLIAFSQQKLWEAEKSQKIHLIEGVGGVMVPINGTFTVLDWIEQVGCPCILVVGSYLGTLSHTLTAVRVLEFKKIPIFAIVINETEGSTVSLGETAESMQALLPSYPIFSRALQKPPCLNKGVDEVIVSLYSQISTKMGHLAITI